MTAWKNSGNNDICPAGFSVPTEAELRADTIEATTTAITNNEKALNSFLNTKACWADVIITAVFPSGHSESTIIVYALPRPIFISPNALIVDSSNAGIFVERRGNAASIRCIKDKDQS
jgi:hypothetical protein